MELVAVGRVIAFVAVLLVVQVLSLAPAVNVVAPERRFGLGSALVVWLVGGVVAAMGSCLSGGLASWIPFVGPALVGTVTVFVANALVLSFVAGLDFARSCAAVGIWWVIQTVIGAVIFAVFGAAAILLGGWSLAFGG